MTSFFTNVPLRSQNDWRYFLAVSLVVVAALPIKIFSVPGFEVTPALIMSPFCLLLLKKNDRLSVAVILFMALCGGLALIGIKGHEGIVRNLLGAASFSSGAPYILVGAALLRCGLSLDQVAKLVLPSAMLLLLVLVSEAYRSGGNLIVLSSYVSASYSSAETTFVNSAFPFYGKYAVITLATIAMLMGCLGMASVSSFSNHYVKYFLLISCSALVFVSYSLWARQVMVGIVIFYAILMLVSFKRKEFWISLSVFLFMLFIWALPPSVKSPVVENNSSAAVQLSQPTADSIGLSSATKAPPKVVSADAFGKYKFDRAVANIKTGDLDDLSTGRMAIYREALSKLDLEIIIKGCGFCDIKDVLGFDFSSLHNVFLTALYKGGVVYAIAYCGSAFSALILLWFYRRSFSRDVMIAAIASIAAQGLVNDTLFFQVIPAILFTITGYCVTQLIELRRSKLDLKADVATESCIASRDGVEHWKQCAP